MHEKQEVGQLLLFGPFANMANSRRSNKDCDTHFKTPTATFFINFEDPLSNTEIGTAMFLFLSADI